MSRCRGSSAQASEVHDEHVDAVLVTRRVQVLRRVAHGLWNQPPPTLHGAQRTGLSAVSRHRRCLRLGTLHALCTVSAPRPRPPCEHGAARDDTGRRGPDRARGSAGREPCRPSRDRLCLPATLRLLLLVENFSSDAFDLYCLRKIREGLV
jgi:hypothetical protein